MTDHFLAEIRIFPFNFPPRGWAFCNGQLLPISQNTALFALLGTNYGGDAKSTFALPDLQGSIPMHTGAEQPGPGLSTHDLGEMGGSETVTLLQSEMPVHTHSLRVSPEDGDLASPSPNRVLARSIGGFAYASPSGDVNMAPEAISPAGGSHPHNNMQPYLTLNYCIALQGDFPHRP